MCSNAQQCVAMLSNNAQQCAAMRNDAQDCTGLLLLGEKSAQQFSVMLSNAQQ